MSWAQVRVQSWLDSAQRPEEHAIDTPDTDGPAVAPQFTVTSASGDDVQLIHTRERDYYTKARDRYLSEYQWTAANDLRAIDRLLALEIQNMRVTWFLNSGMDYQGTDFDAKEEEALRRALKETAAQISEVQRDLGLTKAQREKEKHDSVGAYIQNLKIRAKEHGVKREKELGRALELMHELFAAVGAFNRANDAERQKLGMKDHAAVVDFITDYIEPEFKAVDEHFRENQQRFWIREM